MAASEENGSNGHHQHREPLQLSGALDGVDFFDVTPCIGREYRNVDLSEWLNAPNSDELLRDLAITISQRGVVFFRQQDGINDQNQKKLMRRLSQLAGTPTASGLHIHPIAAVSEEARAHKGDDEEIMIISSRFKEKMGKAQPTKKQSMKTEWHSDIAFEPNPADYTMLRLTEVPPTGVDTLWASGYELFERISEPYQRFLETLTASYHYAGIEVFKAVGERYGFKIHQGPRGSPENVGDALTAVHPVVRTNPVTGWKSLYAIGHHMKQINGVSVDEGKSLEDWFIRLIVENHDIIARHRWHNVNDLAIWDNRSTFHAATPDHAASGHRTGHRAVSVGEKPYFDPKSKSRKEALGLA
ncbi:taurine catabolism dioxygenase [Colletotrichum zoysiae]|uniref:Taurine catabolism dioxygenase n=1 Tax=Colletotrichum zoysiae TaxID=1216348 RepID=A0AAD9HB99_9PEZI|nr:taurine catabolism dioxygenase [Colletotrichum zoysiae]